MHIHTHTHTYTCTYEYTHTYTHPCTHMHTHTDTPAHRHTRTHTHTQTPYTEQSTCVHMRLVVREIKQNWKTKKKKKCGKSERNTGKRSNKVTGKRKRVEEHMDRLLIDNISDYRCLPRSNKGSSMMRTRTKKKKKSIKTDESVLLVFICPENRIEIFTKPQKSIDRYLARERPRDQIANDFSFFFILQSTYRKTFPQFMITLSY